ncbi:MAG TPA: hypothetical protein VK468_01835 [Pyrinomonadaceae bacterium]|nr:hypothetical protein [Pyrinomonadaceae bacterium]
MIGNLPAYVPALFILTTLAAAGFLVYSICQAKGLTRNAVSVAVIFALWLGVQAYLAASGFYQNTAAFPPRIFLFGAIPGLLFAIFVCLIFRSAFIQNLPLRALTLLHVVRVPVELTLYLLFLAKLVPEAMTFAGRNFDILSGLTAPVVFVLGFRAGRLNKPLLIVWNVAALALLINIVATAILAFPSKLKLLAFDQPNVAIMYFPFVWLPTVIVPIVFFAHAAALTRLMSRDAK